jgi:hypothetical protein
MATPMPKTEGNRHYRDDKRVVVFVPIDMGYLLDLVSRYQCITKKKLHEDIWRAGILAYLGIDPDAIESPTPLPRGSAAQKDVKKLVAQLTAER